MKIFILHDAEGRIRGTVATAREGVGVRSTSGLQVHAVVRDDIRPEQVASYLRDVHTSHRLIIRGGVPALQRAT